MSEPKTAVDGDALRILNLIAPALGMKDGEGVFSRQKEVRTDRSVVNSDMARFIHQTPGFIRSIRNADLIDNYLHDNKQACNLSNLKSAYENLTLQGVL